MARRPKFSPGGSSSGRSSFPIGAEVEVRSNDEGFRGAWFEATVVRNLSKYRRYTVAYSTLVSDEIPTSPLQETLHYSYVRPRPPRPDAGAVFGLHQLVDAYHIDRWSAGVVSKLPGGGIHRYTVCFPNTREEFEFEFEPSELRRQVEWVKGSWVTVQDQDKRTKVLALRGTKSAGCRRKSNAGKRSSLPISVSTSSNDDGEVADGSDFVILKRKKAEGPSREVQIELSRARKKSEKGKSLEHLQLVDGMLMECGSKTLTMVEKNSYAASPMLEKSPALIDGQHHSESPSHERITASLNVGKKLPSNPTLRELCHGEGMSQGNGIAESIISEEESSNCKGEGSEHHSKATYFFHPPVRHVASDFLPTAGWGKCKGARGPRKKTKLRGKKLVIGAPHRQRKTPDVVDVKQHAEEEMKKRKRGRPPKKRIIHVHDTVDGMELKQLEERSELVAEEDRRDEVELSNRALSVDVSPNVLPPCHHDEVIERQNSQLIVNIEGNLPANSVISIYWANKQDILGDGYLTPQVESSTQVAKSLYSTAQQLPNVISSSFNNRVEEIRSCVNELDVAGTEAEKQPLSSTFKEDIARGHNELAPSGLPSERVIVMEKERALIDPSPSGSSSEKEVLAFTKKSLLWELVESEEVFRIIPQQPHFHPLEQYSVEFREGIAIGLMVTFAKMVADVSKLRIVDSQQIFEDKLKALGPLESNGFNVQCVRSRLQNLLEIQSNLSQSEGEKVALEAKILEREREKERINVLISELDKVISELEENLTCFREERASKMLEMRSNDSEIVNLEMGVQAAEEAYVSAEQQFNTALAAPW